MIVTILGKKIEFNRFIEKTEHDLIKKIFDEECNVFKREQEIADAYQVAHVNKYGKSFEI